MTQVQIPFDLRDLDEEQITTHVEGEIFRDGECVIEARHIDRISKGNVGAWLAKNRMTAVRGGDKMTIRLRDDVSLKQPFGW